MLYGIALHQAAGHTATWTTTFLPCQWEPASPCVGAGPAAGERESVGQQGLDSAQQMHLSHLTLTQVTVAFPELFGKCQTWLGCFSPNQAQEESASVRLMHLLMPSPKISSNNGNKQSSFETARVVLEREREHQSPQEEQQKSAPCHHRSQETKK